jgi:hypothetical protein
VAYCLDANTFIEAKNRYYGFEFCPAFWDWLDREAENGKLICIDVIYNELLEEKDELSLWLRERKEGPLIRKADDVGTQSLYREIVNYVNRRRDHYQDAAIVEFLSGADPWLIAYAGAHGHIVVTQEVPAPESRRSIKIPDICNQFSIDWCSTFDLLKEMKARFILGGANND